MKHLLLPNKWLIVPCKSSSLKYNAQHSSNHLVCQKYAKLIKKLCKLLNCILNLLNINVISVLQAIITSHVLKMCPSERIEARKISAKIDRELQTSAREHTLKLLLLGAGESGKSTFVKQMKIIHGVGYSIDELKNFTSIIHGNLLTSILEVIKAMDKLNITLHNPSNQVHVSKIIGFISHVKNRVMIPPDIGEAMKLLRKDDGFQECLKCAVEYQLNDSAPYYFQSMNRILDSSYIPHDRDVLQSRV